MRERILYLDRLKGLAIVLVVLGHVALQHQGAGNGFLFKVITSFHMPLFMFMSGYVISELPSWSKIARKCFNWIATLVIFGWMLSIAYMGVSDWEELFMRFGFLSYGGKGGYWYFLTLAISYLTLGVCRQRFKIYLLSLKIYE